MADDVVVKDNISIGSKILQEYKLELQNINRRLFANINNLWQAIVNCGCFGRLHLVIRSNRQPRFLNFLIFTIYYSLFCKDNNLNASKRRYNSFN